MKLFKKHARPFSLGLKLVLLYVYLWLLTGLVVSVAAFDTLNRLRPEDPVWWTMSLIIGIVNIVFASWVLYLFYMRKAHATTAFIIGTIAGLWSSEFSWSASPPDATSIIWSVVMMVLDIVIVLYLLRSKEVRKVLNQ